MKEVVELKNKMDLIELIKEGGAYPLLEYKITGPIFKLFKYIEDNDIIRSIISDSVNKFNKTFKKLTINYKLIDSKSRKITTIIETKSSSDGVFTLDLDFTEDYNIINVIDEEENLLLEAVKLINKSFIAHLNSRSSLDINRADTEYLNSRSYALIKALIKTDVINKIHNTKYKLESTKFMHRLSYFIRNREGCESIFVDDVFIDIMSGVKYGGWKMRRLNGKYIFSNTNKIAKVEFLSKEEKEYNELDFSFVNSKKVKSYKVEPFLPLNFDLDIGRSNIITINIMNDNMDFILKHNEFRKLFNEFGVVTPFCGIRGLEKYKYKFCMERRGGKYSITGLLHEVIFMANCLNEEFDVRYGEKSFELIDKASKYLEKLYKKDIERLVVGELENTLDAYLFSQVSSGVAFYKIEFDRYFEGETLKYMSEVYTKTICDHLNKMGFNTRYKKSDDELFYTHTIEVYINHK